MVTKNHLKVEPYGRLSCFPWNDPDACKDMGVMPGADVLWGCGDNVALLFHTTTVKAARAIDAEGIKPSQEVEVGGHPSFGVAGRTMPAGFWASARPTIPNDSDAWLPSVCNEPWCVLMVQVPRDALKDRYVYEPTWPVPQFCLQPEEIIDWTVLEPNQVPQFMAPETVCRISSYRDPVSHKPSPYLDALDAEAAVIKATRGRGFGQ